MLLNSKYRSTYFDLPKKKKILCDVFASCDSHVWVLLVNCIFLKFEDSSVFAAPRFGIAAEGSLEQEIEQTACSKLVPFSS